VYKITSSQIAVHNRIGTGVFERVAHGPGCAPESALCVFGFLAQLWSSCCAGSKAGWGRLSSYVRNYHSWGARLRAAQSGRFELWFPLVGLPAVRHKHNLKMCRLSWARVPTRWGGLWLPSSGWPRSGRWAGLTTVTQANTPYMTLKTRTPSFFETSSQFLCTYANMTTLKSEI
jgi:hypothetical protein